MKKVICALYNRDGSIKREQRTVDVHPLEQQVYAVEGLAQAKLKEVGEPLSKDEEHELLLEEGAEAVKSKRAEHKAKLAAIEPELKRLRKDAEDAHKKWCDHSELCHKHGHDKNSFDGDATLKLGV